MFETMQELFEILNQRRRRRGSIDFDLKEPAIILDDEGMVKQIIAAERRRGATGSSRSSCSSPTRRSRSTSTTTTCRRSIASTKQPDPLKVEQFEEFVSTLGYSLAAPPNAVKPRALPEARREDPRQARREADRLPDAADDAEGALRPRPTAATSAWRRAATRTSRRRSGAIRTSSSTARCASRGRG